MFSLIDKEWILYGSAGISVACAVFLLLEMLRRAKAAHDAASREIEMVEASSPMIKAFLPIARALGISIRAFLSRGKQDSAYTRFLFTIRKRLSAAGNPQGINPDEYVGFGVLWALLGAMGGAMIFTLMGEEAMFGIDFHVGLAAFLGIFLWRTWLKKQLMIRQTKIRRSLPFALDLLTISMEAGLDFTAALARIVRKVRGTPLGQEFSLMLHEIQLGKTRSEALRDFANRVDVTDVRTVVASLIQADELGAPIGPVLRIQAAQQRERRSQMAEEMAMKAPVKLLFPLVVFIFPTTLIMIFGPMLLSFI